MRRVVRTRWRIPDQAFSEHACRCTWSWGTRAALRRSRRSFRTPIEPTRDLVAGMFWVGALARGARTEPWGGAFPCWAAAAHSHAIYAHNMRTPGDEDSSVSD